METSTSRASVAVVRDGSVLARRDSADTGRSDDLLLLVDACLREAGVALGELSTVAIGAGPGSFTGLRVGMATAKGLCFGAGLSLTPVSSLAALAAAGAELAPGALIVPVLDARRGEIFAGFYREDGGACREVAPERVVRPGELAAIVADLGGAEARLLGDALAVHGEQLAAAGAAIAGAPAAPSAECVARVAAAAAPAETLAAAAPAYLRRPDVEIRFPQGNRGGGTFGTGGKRS